MRPLTSLFLLLCLLLAALMPAAADYGNELDRANTESLLQILRREMRRRAIPDNIEQYNEISSPAKRHARIGGTIVMGKRRR